MTARLHLNLRTLSLIPLEYAFRPAPQPLRPNAKRAEYTIGFLWIALTVHILAFGSGYLQFSLLSRVNSGEGITTFSAQLNDMREQLVRLLQVAVAVVTGILFIRWFRRAYFNLHQKADNLSHTDGWAAGAWFVPFINLGRPYHIMQELFVESRRLLQNEDQVVPQSLTTRKIGFWWALWLGSGFFNNIFYYLVREAASVNDYRWATALSMTANVCSIVAAVLAIRIVKSYAQTEPLLYGVKGDERITLPTASPATAALI